MQIRKLNTLRGLAALIVLVSHYSNESGLWSGALGHGGGQFGVMIFFLLSAFLMAYRYLETPPTACAVRNYAVARIARVLPLFLVVVILSFAAQNSPTHILRELTYNISDAKSFLSHLLLLRGESLLWTVPAEIHFYILFTCVWLLRPRFGKGILFFLVLALLPCALGVGPRVLTTTLFGLNATFHITGVLPYFIVGLLLGHTFRHWQPPVWLCSHWFVAALCLIPFLYPIIFLQVTGRSHGMWADPRILVFMSAIFFAVVFLVPPKNPFLETRIGDKVGEISYSLYLLHLPLLLALKKLGLVTGILGLIIFLALSLTLAFISFSLLEAPMRRQIRGLRPLNSGCKPMPLSSAN
jgi:peptidoglycan/LPS O-acetylase OafA/YrhL